jgi:pimeloyl-ACP methyl ester carboxylesterase
VHLVGHSYGGWLAFQTTARAPAPLASVTLVDPANTLARISGRFWRTAGVLMHSRSERVQRVMGAMLGNPFADQALSHLRDADAKHPG